MAQRSLLMLAAALLILAGCGGSQTRQSAAPSGADLDKAIKQLSDSSLPIRSEAMKTIEAAGERARAKLIAVTDSTNAHAQSAALRLLAGLDKARLNGPKAVGDHAILWLKNAEGWQFVLYNDGWTWFSANDGSLRKVQLNREKVKTLLHSVLETGVQHVSQARVTDGTVQAVIQGLGKQNARLGVQLPYASNRLAWGDEVQKAMSTAGDVTPSLKALARAQKRLLEFEDQGGLKVEKLERATPK